MAMTKTPGLERNCEKCGKHFRPLPQQVRLGRGKYCSISCARSSRTSEERFNSSYTVSKNGCWIWNKAKQACGYGAFSADGVQVGAHRFSFTHFCGPITDNLYVCHRCNNKSCVNPEHLYLGTPSQNTVDAVRDGVFAIGVRCNLAKATDATVLSLRARYSQGVSLKDLARQFNMTTDNARAIVSRKTWKHLA